MRVPKVAAINDLSGLGRCSLTAAIPILSAMGVQACPLPTAVLSNQTGFESFASIDLSKQISRFSHEWRKRGVIFDGIYTGFLNGPVQAGQIADWIDQFRTPQTHVLVDPVLGDRGHIYPVFDHAMVTATRALIAKADIITPNLTEACILAGVGYEEAMRSDGLEAVRLAACALREQGPSTVVITGIPRGFFPARRAFDRDAAPGRRLFRDRRYSGVCAVRRPGPQNEAASRAGFGCCLAPKGNCPYVCRRYRSK